MNHTLIGPTLRQPRPQFSSPHLAWTDPRGVPRSGELLDLRRDEVGVLQLVVRWAEGFVQCVPADATGLRAAPAAEMPLEPPVVTVERGEAVEVGVGRGGQLGLGI